MNKLTTLLQQPQKLFHTQDLALLWNISNRSTLRTTISRYIKNNTLIPIHRGFYSVIPLNQLDPITLGNSALHTYSYLSTETVLSQNGIIFQSVPVYTFCSNQTRRFSLAQHNYRSRQLAPQYLYHPLGITNSDQFNIATTERAVADLLYYNPQYHFDAHDSLDWKEIKTIQREVYNQ